MNVKNVQDQEGQGGLAVIPSTKSLWQLQVEKAARGSYARRLQARVPGYILYPKRRVTQNKFRPYIICYRIDGLSLYQKIR